MELLDIVGGGDDAEGALLKWKLESVSSAGEKMWLSFWLWCCCDEEGLQDPEGEG